MEPGRSVSGICRVAAVLVLAATAAGAGAQGWAPQRNIEIVAGSAPGGSNDNTARAIERILLGAHIAAGRMRVIAVAAPQRLSGPLSSAPTWREQGVNLVYGNWRGIFAPKGIAPAQLSFWESALRRMAQTPEWKADLEKNHWTENFVTGPALAREIEREYAELKTALAEVGLVKNER